MTGIYIKGTVVGRTRKTVNTSEGSAEVVTYVVATDSENRLYVSDFAPQEYFTIGQDIDTEICIKGYLRKDGGVGISYRIYKPREFTDGEAF